MPRHPSHPQKPAAWAEVRRAPRVPRLQARPPVRQVRPGSASRSALPSQRLHGQAPAKGPAPPAESGQAPPGVVPAPRGLWGPRRMARRALPRGRPVRASSAFGPSAQMVRLRQVMEAAPTVPREGRAISPLEQGQEQPRPHKSRKEQERQPARREERPTGSVPWLKEPREALAATTVPRQPRLKPSAADQRVVSAPARSASPVRKRGELHGPERATVGREMARPPPAQGPIRPLAPLRQTEEPLALPPQKEPAPGAVVPGLPRPPGGIRPGMAMETRAETEAGSGAASGAGLEVRRPGWPRQEVRRVSGCLPMLADCHLGLAFPGHRRSRTRRRSSGPGWPALPP
ncbi:MAG: hypothetical protein OZSIB_4225 [Candidatus Ozemobacter sibiricus]|uniref:Uncharacterized protein n=1 Tax=Candidatus Ozemobacter sibiricus TaxID=2268124 RepID=A0A367ZQ41_9BACT|nr:MAG: hypothetical protein OZSIB_4225 [Candidatus Ozemobacter sibiricus]